MSGPPPGPSGSLALADAVREACIQRLRDDYEQAAIQGLCGEGAFEYALDRLRQWPAADLLAALPPDQQPPFEQGTDS